MFLEKEEMKFIVLYVLKQYKAPITSDAFYEILTWDKEIMGFFDAAEKLSELIGDAWLFVNLIPYNPSREDDFRRSEEDSIRAFYDVLKKHNIGVTRRREFGGDLNAACGQLRSDRIKKDVE